LQSTERTDEERCDQRTSYRYQNRAVPMRRHDGYPGSLPEAAIDRVVSRPRFTAVAA
jgi:endonuclease/exonuclease/phosphatase family metal-dependent hydrolase